MELSGSQREFINYLKEEYQDEIATDNLENLLSLNPDQIKVEMEKALERLNQLKVGENYASPRVKKAWQVLRNFFETKSPILKAEGILSIEYGSVTFDDPRNLDFDILLVTESQNDNVENMIDPWVNELSETWKSVGSPGHISHFSVDRLKMHCLAFNNDWTDYISKGGLQIGYDFDGAAIVLSGEPINKADLDSIKSLRSELLHLASETPELMASLASNFQNVVVTREVRRAGLEL